MIIVERAELGGARGILIASGVVAEVSSVLAVVSVGPVGTIGS